MVQWLLQHALVSTWRYPGTDNGIFVITGGMAVLRTEEQMRTAADVKGAREGGDTTLCRGWYFYKQPFVGVVTTHKADVYHRLSCLNQF